MNRYENDYEREKVTCCALLVSRMFRNAIHKHARIIMISS